MKELDLLFVDKTPINSEVLSKFTSELSDYLPNIETLAINGHFSKLNLDNLINLKNLFLYCYFVNDFNFDLFKNICGHLEKIVMHCNDIDDESLAKLFDGHTFPYLHKLTLSETKITKLEKKLFAPHRFPMLQNLIVYENKELRKIDPDAFSNLNNLICLVLQENCIESIDKSNFSNLTNIEFLVLDGNPIKHVEENVFSDLKSLQHLSLDNIQLTTLSPKSLAGLDNLKCLSLRDNKLTNFDFHILDNICRNIVEIDLSENPINDKYIYPLKKDIDYICDVMFNEG